MIYTNCRQAPAELITPQEITAIMKRAGTVGDIERAEAIEREYIKVTGITTFKNDPALHYRCMLATIYQAGRIQGIREQKAKYADLG